MPGRTQGNSGRFLAILRLVLSLLIVGTGLMSYRACSLQSPVQGRTAVRLVRVIDGDTIRVFSGTEELKVRLVGIDAAELGSAESFRCALRVAELLEDASRIEIEPEPTKPTDKYGRTLAWVWVGEESGEDMLLQELLVQEGLCELYRDAKGSKYYGRLELAWRMH